MDYLHALHQSFIGFLNALAKEDTAKGRSPMRFSRSGYGQPLRGTTTGRYVILRCNVGQDNERLMGELTEATLYQVIPWNTDKQAPQVYLDRQWVAIEAPLPQEAQNASVVLDSLVGGRHGGSVIILGPNEYGTTISLSLHELIHVLIGGETGSGKTWTMRSLAYQLANGENRIVLIDGKNGEGLSILNGIPGQVGPLAYEQNDVRNALGWVRAEMIARYEVVVNQRGGKAWGKNEGPPHICVFFDEFQNFRRDSTVTALSHDLAAMGRSARIHLFYGTQEPKVSMFGPGGGATRNQFGTRIAHAVNTYQASEAIIGSNSPRADFLQPKGDAYVLSSVGSYPLSERVQIAYVPESVLEKFCNGRPEMLHWPTFDAATLDDGTGQPGRPEMRFSNEQLAAAIYAARNGWGRPRLQQLLTDLEDPIAGTEPASRLRDLGREIDKVLLEINRTQMASLLESNRLGELTD